MRLLVDLHIFDEDDTEGITTYLKGLYSAVIRLSSPIELYFVAHNTEKLKKIFGNHPNIRYIAYKNTNKYYRLAIDLPHIIKCNNIDVAHFQYISPLRKCCKEIITTHDILFKDFPQYFPFSYRLSKGILFKLAAQRADLLFTVSEYSRNTISNHYGINPNKIHVTPNAVSEDFFMATTVQLSKIKQRYCFDKYILYVSRFEPRKNHINLAKAYVNLRLWEQEIKLVFVGKETIVTKEYHAYYNSLPHEMKKNIIHLPYLPFDELLAIYKGCNLFVYPSIAEGFGIPAIEAAAAGRPCLCSNNTAMSDFYFFGDGLFNPNDIKELEQKIQVFFEGLFKPDTHRIQTIVKEKYQWDRVADHFIKTMQTQLQ
ncbi:MAG: glycosyltransferase family 4 protein [Bacteroidales bacterium]|jgi:glycosyltransferase involved in cell wall biosynthesis|nr:glycosyltransferase family 4 protein [Bacteroidales bacterium]